MNEYSLLFTDLNKILEGKFETIRASVLEFEKDHDKPFHIFDLSEFSMVVLKRTNTPIHYLNIGFPFPLISKDIQFKEFTTLKTSINIFLRGEPIRKIQREKYTALCDKKINNENFDTSNIAINKIIYIDPYTFIGDSFIGLHFIEEVSKNYALTKDPTIQIISRQYLELEEFYKTQPYSLIGIHSIHSDQNTLVIMPDLIDSQFEFCYEFLKLLIKKPFGAIEIVSRNLKIIKEKEKNICLHNGRHDTLLKDSNIEDYMNECVNPINHSKKLIKLQNKTNKSNSHQLLINPFSSTVTKYIPVELFSKIFQKIQTQDEKTQWELVGGMVGRKEDFFWIRDFLSNSYVEQNVGEKFKIKHYSNLKLLISKLNSEKFKFGITADTSIAHILNMTATPQITIYNTAFWDTTSIQSLASDSPLGFSRFNINQFPVINYGQFDEVSEVILSCMNFLNGNISETNFDYIDMNRKLLKKLFLPITSTMIDFSLTDIYIETKEILSELNSKSSKYEASWILNSYPTQYLIEDCINQYPEKSKRIFESYLKTSPLFKVFSLYESKVN